MQTQVQPEVNRICPMSANLERDAIQTALCPTGFMDVEETDIDERKSTEPAIRLSLPSSMHSIYVLDAVISEIVSEMGFDEHTSEQVILAVTEAGTNAIKHGNKCDPNKPARFKFIVNPDKLTVIVQDQGTGFDRQKIPSPWQGTNRFKGSGRGIFLVEACMDVVTYEASGTIVRMMKYKK